MANLIPKHSVQLCWYQGRQSVLSLNMPGPSGSDSATPPRFLSYWFLLLQVHAFQLIQLFKSVRHLPFLFTFLLLQGNVFSVALHLEGHCTTTVRYHHLQRLLQEAFPDFSRAYFLSWTALTVCVHGYVKLLYFTVMVSCLWASRH